MLGASLVAGVALGACGSGALRAGPPVTVAPVTTVAPITTVAPSTAAPSTAAYSPSAPQASPDLAAERLMGAWASGDQAVAATVASPAAVSVLFAIRYPSGYLQGRGCTAGVNPGTCTYRDTATGEIYEIGVVETPRGWFVASVTPET